MQQGLGSNTWWEEAECKQFETATLRSQFVLDKLIKREIAKFQAGGAVAFPGRPMGEPSQLQPGEVTRAHGS